MAVLGCRRDGDSHCPALNLCQGQLAALRFGDVQTLRLLQEWLGGVVVMELREFPLGFLYQVSIIPGPPPCRQLNLMALV